MPQKPITGNAEQMLITQDSDLAGEDIVSDKYLKFLVKELKPFIDQTYPTQPGKDDTFIMGSSMGGMISAYAIAEYPAVFGGAACLSTHWSRSGEAVIDWYKNHWPITRRGPGVSGCTFPLRSCSGSTDPDGQSTMAWYVKCSSI
jgi:pimeloyl-ACP methyl ester carboxylesterase